MITSVHSAEYLLIQRSFFLTPRMRMTTFPLSLSVGWKAIQCIKTVDNGLPFAIGLDLKTSQPHFEFLSSALLFFTINCTYEATSSSSSSSKNGRARTLDEQPLFFTVPHCHA